MILRGVSPGSSDLLPHVILSQFGLGSEIDQALGQESLIRSSPSHTEGNPFYKKLTLSLGSQKSSTHRSPNLCPFYPPFSLSFLPGPRLCFLPLLRTVHKSAYGFPPSFPPALPHRRYSSLLKTKFNVPVTIKLFARSSPEARV